MNKKKKPLLSEEALNEIASEISGLFGEVEEDAKEENTNNNNSKSLKE